MSFEMNIKETSDGWIYAEQPKELGISGIFSRDLERWNACMMNIFNTSDLFSKWNKCKNNAERKEIVWESMKIELRNLEENLRADLNRSIKIYPKIRRETK